MKTIETVRVRFFTTLFYLLPMSISFPTDEDYEDNDDGDGDY